MDILFDSGAFSAWKLGKPVDIDAYCDYLHRNQGFMGHYVNLDEINPDSPEEAARVSFENYLYMRKQGLDPVPVFHAKEDISWLYKMLDAGAQYIGLAALSLGSHKYRSEWYANVWDKLTYQGKPLVKVHALGEGRFDALAAFPWYSADSTSWVYAAQRNAVIQVEGYRSVTMRNDGLNDPASQDIDKLFGHDKEAWDAFLEKHKVNPEALKIRNADAMVIRTYLALMYYLEQEARVTALCPIKHRSTKLFGGEQSFLATEAFDLPELKYYSVLGNNYITWACLAYAGATRGLISYFYVAGSGKLYYNDLEDYAYDPIGLCQNDHIESSAYKRSYAILKEYVGK
jgi:hypothetical protein